MTRLGWGILVAVLLVVAGFSSLVSFGAAPASTAKRSALPDVADGSGDTDHLLVPVAGYPRTKLTNSWGDPRGGGTRGHRGIDVMAPAGAAVVAVTAGRIEKLFESRLGGTTLYQRSADGRWRYYYAHLAGYAEGVREGMAVRAGQKLAYVGDTGDAGMGNYHLHFEASRIAPGMRWWQGEDVNPYPLLARGRDGR